MINYESLFKITYGMYIICAGNKKQSNGYFSNTFFQISADPPRFAASCHKNNFTTGFIRESGFFSVSVLPQTTSPELIGRFGYRSGKDFSKMEGLSIYYAENEVPVVLNECIAWLVCRVVEVVDAGTHLLFIGELSEAEIIDAEAEPMTYSYYRQVKRGLSPKNAPTYIDKNKLAGMPGKDLNRKYRCTVCDFVYDEKKEGKAFKDLQKDWVCPVCGAEKEDFISET